MKPRCSKSANKDRVPEVAVRTLRDVAKRCRLLKQEADLALDAGDRVTYRRKLEARAKLLVKLPKRLHRLLLGAHTIRVINHQTLNVMFRIQNFANEAQEALAKDTTFCLAVLLIDRGTKIGDKNHLEQFIDSLR